MSLVVCEDVTLALGGRTLLEDAQLQVGPRDRIGLIGPNGSGKSSLLRLLEGELAPEGGRIRRRRGLRIGHLPQETRAVSGGRLRAFVVDSVPGRADLATELEQARAELERARESGAEPQELLDWSARIADITERLDHFETEYSPHRAVRILMGLGFEQDDLERDVQELSGGWRMRAVLAALLFQHPDLLLLDEPTNHLDMPSVAWLGAFLSSYRGAFVLISHDREFLNEQIGRVVSFEPEGLRTYDGNYEQYKHQRAEEQTVLEARAKNLEQRRAQMERFVERFRAKASKARQAQSRLKQLEKMGTVERPREKQSIRFRFPTSDRSGKEVLAVSGLGKSYGANAVLDGVDLRVDRGDRIAIIGRNGAGKTTLLRILAGEMQPDRGELRWGYRTKVGYYAQHHADVLDPTQTAYDAVWERVAEGNATLVRGALGALRLGDEDVEKRVGVLSGGERARVTLARLLVDPGNVLLMDEPTNHLDLESSEALVDALAGFDGTLLFVSHNRHLLRALATKIWCVQGGGVDAYPGTLDDYLRVAAGPETDDGAAQDEGRDRGEPGAGTGSEPTPKERRRREAELRQQRSRVLGPLRRRVAELEERIGELEQEKAQHTEALADPTLYDDPVRREEVTHAYQQVTEDLDELTAEWMDAHEQLEARERELTSPSSRE